MNKSITGNYYLEAVKSVKEAVWERIEQPTLNKKGEGETTTYLTHGTRHFMVFLVASHVTNPKGQLPDEDCEIRSQCCVVANTKFQK